jgi:hypothetical protein
MNLNPNIPHKRIIATSFIRGDVIKKEKVTPVGIPLFKKVKNKGSEEQEQKGVIAPRIAEKK